MQCVFFFFIYFSFELLLNWFFHWIIITRQRRIVQLFCLRSHAVQLLWAMLAVALQIAVYSVHKIKFLIFEIISVFLLLLSCLAGERASVCAQFSSSHLHFFDNSVVFLRSAFRSVRVYFLIAPLRVWMIAAETERQRGHTKSEWEARRERETAKRHSHECVVLLLFGYETTKLDGAFYGIRTGNAQPNRVQSTAVFCGDRKSFSIRHIPNIESSKLNRTHSHSIFIQFYYTQFGYSLLLAVVR